MRILRDRASIATLIDPQLRQLIEQRVEALAEFADDFELHELVTFIVVEPGDSLSSIDAALGFPILSDPSAPRPFELCEEHPGYFEIVFVVSDDGYGIEVFVPKVPGVDAALLAMCAMHAVKVDP